MRLTTIAILFGLCACEDGPAYESERCKDLRADVRQTEATIAHLLTLSTPVQHYVNALELQIREQRDENPECFDPSL